MAYKYCQSDKFRADSIRFAGYVLCTPFCMIILDLLRSQNHFSIMCFAIASLLFIAGLKCVFHSYDVMLEKDKYGG